MLSALGLVVAIVLLIFGAYKRVGIFPMTLICSLIVILTSGLPLLPVPLGTISCSLRPHACTQR